MRIMARLIVCAVAAAAVAGCSASHSNRSTSPVALSPQPISTTSEQRETPIPTPADATASAGLTGPQPRTLVREKPVLLPAGVVVYASPPFVPGIPLPLFRIERTAGGTLRRESLFEFASQYAKPGNPGVFSWAGDDSMTTIVALVCQTQTCEYGGGGDRGQAAVVRSSDGGQTWEAIGVAAGDGYVAAVTGDGALIGDQRNSASTLATYRWRWLPSGDLQPLPTERQGYRAQGVPGIGVAWAVPTGPVITSDGTEIGPPGSRFPAVRLPNGDTFFANGPGHCKGGSPAQGTCIEVFGPDEVVRRRYEWGGPERLQLSSTLIRDNLPNGWLFVGYLVDEVGNPQGVIVDLAAGTVRPIADLVLDGRPLIPYRALPASGN